MQNLTLGGTLARLAVLSGALLAATAAYPASESKATEFKVLEQPAMANAKASGAAILAVTRAGTRLVAVGERGIVLLSDDDGKTWRQASVPVQVSLTAVQFATPKEGWAVGHLGVVLHSADGGQTWQKQLDGRQAAALSLAAAEANPAAERLLTDAKQLVSDGPDKPLLGVYFSDARQGYVVGAYGLILRTTDGGQHWQAWQAHLDKQHGSHLYAVQAVGNALYLAGERGTLLRSDDQGEHFITQPSPYKGSYFGLLAGQRGDMVLYGLRGNAFHSADQGNSWQAIKTGLGVSISAGLSLANGDLLLLSQTGDMLLSHDQGASFQALPNREPQALAGIAQAGNADLVVAGLRGVRRLSLPH